MLRRLICELFTPGFVILEEPLENSLVLRPGTLNDSRLPFGGAHFVNGCEILTFHD